MGGDMFINGGALTPLQTMCGGVRVFQKFAHSPHLKKSLLTKLEFSSYNPIKT